MVTEPRPEMIKALVDEMIDGCSELAVSASEDEVISAVFTLAMRMTKHAKKSGADMGVVKDVLMQMLMECTDERRPS